MTAQLPRLLTIVLAAGDGVRMRSARPKALHEVAGRRVRVTDRLEGDTLYLESIEADEP